MLFIWLSSVIVLRWSVYDCIMPNSADMITPPHLWWRWKRMWYVTLNSHDVVCFIQPHCPNKIGLWIDIWGDTGPAHGCVADIISIQCRKTFCLYYQNTIVVHCYSFGMCNIHYTNIPGASVQEALTNLGELQQYYSHALLNSQLCCLKPLPLIKLLLRYIALVNCL